MALFKVDLLLEGLNDWLCVLRALEDMDYVDTAETDDRKKIFITYRGVMAYFTTNTGCSGCFYRGDDYGSLVLEIHGEGDGH